MPTPLIQADEFLSQLGLHSLKQMEWEAKSLVEGIRVGKHKSPFHGFSTEFSQYRNYNPGDDPRHLDWKAFARTEHHLVKQYEDETDTLVHLVLDTSASMGYIGAQGALKWRSMLILAAGLGLLAKTYKDKVKLFTGTGLTHLELPDVGRSSREMGKFFQTLLTLRPEGPSKIAEWITQAARKCKSRSFVFLFTDAWHNTSDLAHSLQALAARKVDARLIRLLSPEERDLQAVGDFFLQDLENPDQRIEISALELTPAYRLAFQQHQQNLVRHCLQLGIRFCDLDLKSSLLQSFRTLLG